MYDEAAARGTRDTLTDWPGKSVERRGAAVPILTLKEQHMPCATALGGAGITELRRCQQQRREEDEDEVPKLQLQLQRRDEQHVQRSQHVHHIPQAIVVCNVCIAIRVK